MQPSDNVIDDLDWETYRVDDGATHRIQNGSQCICHVLEKSVGDDSSQRSPVSFGGALYGQLFGI